MECGSSVDYERPGEEILHYLGTSLIARRSLFAVRVRGGGRYSTPGLSNAVRSKRVLTSVDFFRNVHRKDWNDPHGASNAGAYPKNIDSRLLIARRGGAVPVVRILGDLAHGVTGRR